MKQYKLNILHLLTVCLPVSTDLCGKLWINLNLKCIAKMLNNSQIGILFIHFLIKLQMVSYFPP